MMENEMLESGTGLRPVSEQDTDASRVMDQGGGSESGCVSGRLHRPRHAAPLTASVTETRSRAEGEGFAIGATEREQARDPAAPGAESEVSAADLQVRRHRSSGHSISRLYHRSTWPASHGRHRAAAEHLDAAGEARDAAVAGQARGACDHSDRRDGVDRYFRYPCAKRGHLRALVGIAVTPGPTTRVGPIDECPETHANPEEECCCSVQKRKEETRKKPAGEDGENRNQRRGRKWRDGDSKHRVDRGKRRGIGEGEKGSGN
ncbi:hypothetical protein NDU88_006644 [Pleurodeles waltl]|uniref:Uncharacterized protein n=1 Tax=Pleurodeles waltl TaxID=8319 RepID=A0AAV7TXQ9_PLEWA|nr:hypothetical protein NDU88_006644 [Pleurodeles waltl]